jgi:hypothetical protein
VKKFKIGSLGPEACAGAPAPPRWNARSARVFACEFRTLKGRILTVQFFHSSRGGWRSDSGRGARRGGS